MTDPKNTHQNQESLQRDLSKETWVVPEKVDYDYASLTQGGANLRTTDDVAGDNYRVS